MKKLYLALCMAIAIVGAAQAQTKHVKVNVGDFTELFVADGVNVNYIADPSKKGTVEFDCPDGMLNNFLLKVNNKGKFTIQVSDAKLLKNLPTLTVWSSELYAVTNQGDSTVNIVQLNNSFTFKAMTSGNGKITVSDLEARNVELHIATGKGDIYANGTTDSLHCILAGTGQIHALGLMAKDISCNTAGSGHIYVNSTGGELKVKGIGSGKVHYKGTPSSVKVKKVGTVSAQPYTGED